MSSSPGWYPDPKDARNKERYWDGEDYTDQTRPRADPLPPPKRSQQHGSKPKSAPVALILALLIGVSAYACGIGDDTTGDSPKSGGTSGSGQSTADLIGTRKLVEQTCREAVENRLKSPSSAEFSDVQAKQDDSAGTRWTTTGKVDSENSFGASIRNTFTCTSTYDIASETARTSVTNFSGN
ncbi:DUF2510 domain-containing protein [Rhodococcus ruber]|uniref:DUF2510 domain-containing protein n=1 Tax=Rhodococcus ruber TaxID=1830 RepID=UPI003784AFC7